MVIGNMAVNNSTKFLCHVSSKCYSPFQSSSLSCNIIAVCMVNLIFALVGVFLDFLMIFTFWYSSKLRNNVCYFPIMVLSCTDLVVVAVVHPLGILYNLSELTRNHDCVYDKLHGYPLAILCGLSFGALLGMNIERYLAIIHPYFHQRTVTKPMPLFLVGLLWILVLTGWLFMIYSTVTVSFGMTSFYFLLYILIYARILGIVSKKRRERFIIPTGSSIQHEQSISKYKEHLRDLKLVSMNSLVILCSVIGYCPVMVAYQFKFTEVKPCSEPAASTNNFQIWAGILTAMNSTFNCLIFFWRNKTLRNESTKLLSCDRVQRIGHKMKD